MRDHAWWIGLAFVAAAFAGCTDMGEESVGGSGDMAGDGADGGTMGTDMGMGGARVTELAMAPLDALPEGPLVWVAFDLATENASAAPHSHGPAFLYGARDDARVHVDGEERVATHGQAIFLMEGVEHAHQGGGWEIRLDSPGAEAPEGAQRVFESDALEGVPGAPVDLHFVHVALPPGTMTSVHEHAGPEYVWVSEGTIEHQSGTDGTIALARGDDHSLPPRTTVQKRNPGDAEATFLSFFVVDPDEPFVIDSSFG